MDANKILWSKRVHTRTDQQAWSDVVHYEVPFTGEANLEKIQAAINNRFKPQSGFGALRWSTGVWVDSIDADRKVILVHESIRLCD